MSAAAVQSTARSAASSPVDLKALCERVLPALSAQKKACIELLAGDNCTLSEVVERISTDPGLTVAVLQTVNRKRGEQRTRIASIDSAANLLGQTRLRACIEKLPELEKTCRATDLPTVLMLWERQRHAAAQAGYWAQLREDKSPSECRIVASCAGLPELMTCLYHPETYRAVLARQNAHGSQAASRQALGTGFSELGRRLVQRWRLPELLDDVFRPERYEFYRPLGIMLAGELARHVDTGWYRSPTVACLEVIAEYLGWPYDRCVEMVHQVAVRCARDGGVPGAVTAAARLVQLPGEVVITGVVPLAPAPPERSRAEQQQAHLQAKLLQVKQQLHRADLRTVLNVTMSALSKEFAFSRCAFFTLARGETKMQPRVVLGAGAAALQQLEIDAGKSKVFARLLQKPQSLLVNAGNRARYAPHLPGAFKAACAESFACMSVFANDRPIGMVYADRHTADSFGAEHYTCFKTLCSLVNQSLRESVAQAQAAAPERRQAGSG